MSSSQLKTIFIRVDEDPYWNSVRECAEAIRQKSLLPFLGAGISIARPSFLPLAKDLVDPLVSALWKAKDLIDLTELCQQQVLDAERVLRDARLERLLDALHRAHGHAALEYLSVLNGKRWNFNHSAIAALAKEGLLPFCITLNFDLLIEYAAKHCEFPFLTECPLTGDVIPFGSGNPIFRIIKPHGSFATEGDSYRFLSATLSQVGQKPARPNVDRINEAIQMCPVLLVAGYSDHDWDIFPILVQRGNNLQKIIWIQYAGKEDVKKRMIPANESNLLQERVIPWLQNGKAQATLLVGDLKEFLEDALNELPNVEIKAPIEGIDRVRQVPDATPFVIRAGPPGDQEIKTAVALAHIIQQTGRLSESLLAWLHENRLVRENPNLAWQVEDMLGHTAHTYGHIDEALHHTRHTIQIKENNELPIASDLVWLGYEYLCLAKRPNPLKPISFLLAPFHLWKGLRFLREGPKISASKERPKLEALAAYYRADLLHSWGNMMMFFGHRFMKVLKPLFRFLDRSYSSIGRLSDLMDYEYYWLRHLEARLLSGITFDNAERKKVEKKLDELHQAYHLVQNNVQIGNTHAYRALLLYLLDNDFTGAIRELDRAQNAWKEAGKGISSGERRIVLFRRFIGQRSFLSSIRDFLRLS